MPSAVLVPLLCKDGEVHVLLTKRSQKVMYHKGEISFPGGAYGEPDRDLRETAMRESWEEIGLKSRDVEIIGDLDEIPAECDLSILSLPPGEIIPALESSHAVFEAVRLAPSLPKDKIILVNLSGRGDKDCNEIADILKRRQPPK